MDAEVVKREILQTFSNGPQPDWRMPAPTRVDLWWKGGYAQIDERETEYLVRVNSCDQSTPGTPANRFHWAVRKEKGLYKYNDERTTGTACFVLQSHDKKRAHLRFLEDPVFGLLENSSEYGTEYWSGVVTLDFFYGREATLHLDLSEGGSVSELHDWYRAFLLRQNELLAQVEPRIVEYAQWYGRQIGSDLGIKSAQDMRRHVNPRALTLYPRTEWDEEAFEVKSKFHWDVSWDDEHGCTARLHDWTIIDVGLDYC